MQIVNTATANFTYLHMGTTRVIGASVAAKVYTKAPPNVPQQVRDPEVLKAACAVKQNA